MPNHLHSAAATGLPAVTRRAVLAGAPAIAAISVLPAHAAETRSDWRQLHEELIEAHRASDEAEACYIAAAEATASECPMVEVRVPDFYVRFRGGKGVWAWIDNMAPQPKVLLSPGAVNEHFDGHIQKARAGAANDWPPEGLEEFIAEGERRRAAMLAQCDEWAVRREAVGRKHGLLALQQSANSAWARVEALEAHIKALPVDSLAAVQARLAICARRAAVDEIDGAEAITELRIAVAATVGAPTVGRPRLSE